MKKSPAMSYLTRTKWIIVLFIVLFLVVFGRTVKSPSLTKTAIVLGVGIDFDDQTRLFEVTTQSALMTSSSGDSAETTYATFTAKGETISAALEDISLKMGLMVSLAHCEVVFLSKEALKLDRLQLFYPLTGKYALREQTNIVTGDKSPRETLAVRIGTTISAPFFLHSALNNMEGADGMIRTSVKDLLARSLSRSKATAIPYITSKEMQDQPQGPDEELKGNFEFDLTKAMVFNDKDSAVLDEDLSEILALYLSTEAYGSINHTAQSGESVEFHILDKEIKTSAKGRTISASIKLTVDLLDVQFFESDKVLTAADEEIKNAAKMLENELKERMLTLFELSKQTNIDFLGLQAKAYQSVGRKLEEDCLDTLNFIPSVKIEVKEAA